MLKSSNRNLRLSLSEIFNQEYIKYGKYEEILNDLRKNNKSDVLKDSLKKFKAKIKTTLAKPNDLYFKILKYFTKKIEIIMPYYDYFDTNERKIFENFEVQISEYYEILDNLNKKVELKFKD